MKSLITTLVTIGLIAPTGAAYAIDIDTMIEAAKNGNGTYVETHSSVSTGGQTAQSGENVQTGDAHASSYTEIHADNDGGEVKVKIETSENGETTTKEFTQDIPKGEGVKVEASAESNNGESSAEVKVNDEVVEADTSESHTASASAAVSARISLLFTEKIPSLFKRVFSLFRWS
jgi:hypothetical protein